MIQTKVVDSFYLARLLAAELFLTYIDLDTINPSKIPLNIIDQRYQQKHKVLPIAQENKKLFLAIVNPTQQFIFDEIRFATGLILEYKIADEQKFIQLLKKIKETPSIKNNTINLADSPHPHVIQSKDYNLAKIFDNSGADDETWRARSAVEEPLIGVR